MHGKRAFTLIELLVVVGIIGLLATTLLPALIGVRAKAERVVCQENLHAVVIANVTYAECDRNHRYILAAEDMTSGNLKRWFGVREDTNSPFQWVGPFAEFLPGGDIRPCPSFQRFDESAGQDDAFEAGCGGYGYNDLYIGGRFDLYKNIFANRDNSRRGYANSAALSSIANSAQTVMFADTAFKQRGELIAYSFTHAPKWIPKHPYGSGAPNPPIHFRHQGLANVGWVDGHVTSEPMTFSTGYTTHGEISADEAADIGLGWFGDYYEDLPEANYLFDLD